MRKNFNIKKNIVTETIRGVVERITYHNAETGFSILRVKPFRAPHQQSTVKVHQTNVFAGATMKFKGYWERHPKYGPQFHATEAIEEKPATTAAIEKYLGSGLIKDVGPKTARKIVTYFGDKTLDIIESNIEKLIEIPGIGNKTLSKIKKAWREQRSIRKVMMFLQSHGISTLFAVRIFKEYGDNAIQYVTDDPYRLAKDFYGIGFFSADKVALSIGIKKDSPKRIMAAINHILASSRENGHCYLTKNQICRQVEELLKLDVSINFSSLFIYMEKEGLLKVRKLADANGTIERCYYSKSIFFDELYVANKISGLGLPPKVDQSRVSRWIKEYCQKKSISLSREQLAYIKSIVSERFSILTGGPGCGKTTSTLVLVRLLEAMGRKVLLAAPTGRAAQRMKDVIGRESKTIHRLLEWHWNGFKKNEDSPLNADFLIIDECSMLDINLTASLLKAVRRNCQILFIGDADQLPSVGAGNVLRDIIDSEVVPYFRLTKVFRQAQKSLIVTYAHQINNGRIPHIESPFNRPKIWETKEDCLFIDSDEATKEQIDFIRKVKRFYDIKLKDIEKETKKHNNLYEFRINDP